jgi:hypothetical protein
MRVKLTHRFRASAKEGSGSRVWLTLRLSKTA